MTQKWGSGTEILPYEATTDFQFLGLLIGSILVSCLPREHWLKFNVELNVGFF